MSVTVNSTRTVSKARYLSAAFMAEEQAKLWPRVWLLAGAARELVVDGDFFVFELGAQSILVVRQGGQPRAFFNVCQHRGNLLCPEERGRVGEFRCAYHHWTYGLDGQCTATPGVTVERPHLSPLECEVRHGFVWIRMTPGGETLDAFLAPVEASLTHARPADFALTSARTVEVEANWKTSVDASNESYHLPALHPELAEHVDLQGITVELRGIHSEMRIPLRQGDMKVQVYLFPNVQLNFGGDTLELYRHRPHRSLPEQMYFDEETYRRGAVGVPERRRFRHGAEALGPVMGRDVDLLPLLHRGMRSQGFANLQLTVEEAAITNMHRAIDLYLAVHR